MIKHCWNIKHNIFSENGLEISQLRPSLELKYNFISTLHSSWKCFKFIVTNELDWHKNFLFSVFQCTLRQICCYLPAFFVAFVHRNGYRIVRWNVRGNVQNKHISRWCTSKVFTFCIGECIPGHWLHCTVPIIHSEHICTAHKHNVVCVRVRLSSLSLKNWLRDNELLLFSVEQQENLLCIYVIVSIIQTHHYTIRRHISTKKAAMSLLLSCTENCTSFNMKPLKTDAWMMQVN